MQMDRRVWSCSSAKALCVACVAVSASALKIDATSLWYSEEGSIQNDVGQWSQSRDVSIQDGVGQRSQSEDGTIQDGVGQRSQSEDGSIQDGVGQRSQSKDGSIQDGIGQRSQFGWKSVHMMDQREQVELYTDGQEFRQNMRNFEDTQYLTYFKLGEQTLETVLDTGSYELVVFSTVCSTCGQAAKYNPSLSATHKAGKMVSGQFYGSGETWSRDASDHLLIGPYSVNQSFWEVTKARMPVLQYSEFQAILGLGPPESTARDAWALAREAAHNVSNALQTQGVVDDALLQKARDKAKIAVAYGKRDPVLKSVNESIFSICLGKDPGSDGLVIWNDSSVALHPELFHAAPVVGKDTWSVEVRNARLGYLTNSTEHAIGTDELTVFNNSTSVSLGCEDGCGVLLDTGTSLLSLPHNVINSLVRLISALDFNCSNMKELPHLLFDVNGQTLSLPPDTFVANVDMAVPQYLQGLVKVRNLGAKRCELVAMESYAKTDSGPLWIFGMPFFRKYYTSFGVARNSPTRSVYFAGASEHCTPVRRRVEVHDGPQEMWKRNIDPTKLWMPYAVQLAASTDYVRL